VLAALQSDAALDVAALVWQGLKYPASCQLKKAETAVREIHQHALATSTKS
jgi:hypothetical protein